MQSPAAHAAVTGDGAVKTTNGQLVAVCLTAAAATSTIVLYDNASAASGTVLCSLSCVANTSVTFTPAVPFAFSNGIYADINGASAVAYVVYL